jgi:hypothetical protein
LVIFLLNDKLGSRLGFDGLGGLNGFVLGVSITIMHE